MRTALLLVAVLAAPVHAGWTWNEPVTVNAVAGPAVFPHLESANRQGVAVSDGIVAVAWEDNRSGTPQCYLATKPAGAVRFDAEIRLSRDECFEPVVVGIGQGRFVAAWEEAGRVRGRVLPGGESIALSEAEGGQATLAASGDRLYAAWAEQAGRFRRIVVARLDAGKDALRIVSRQPVEANAPVDEQGWPALAIAGDGRLAIAWEDRRNRHTVPMVSQARDGQGFAAPARLTDVKSGSSQGLGAGIGAMRPTLAAWGNAGVVAAWLDKRDFLSGYDVYAAFDAGEGKFGRNLKVQDSFGDNMAQWHAKLVGHASGKLVALWDDARDGTPDVWFAEWDGMAFGENVAVPGAAGAGAQSDPVAVLDADGTLHVAWLDRDADGATRVRYARGTAR